MAKKSDTSNQWPLSHYWTPPPIPIEGGLGEPFACLATTYEFDAEFFETELLPRFLGLKFDHTENELSFVVEREEALALARVAVLVDFTRYDSSQTTLRWDQVPIQIPGGVQHAKITVLAWKNLVRVIIGSANLNRIAYRRNRELFSAVDFWNNSDSTPLRLLRDTLDLLTLMLEWSRCSQPAIERTHETADGVRRMTRGWRNAPTDFTPRERPRATLAVTHPRSPNRSARSALSKLLQLWGKRRTTAVTVVTPFAAPDPDPKTGDPVVNRLAEIPMTRKSEGWLIVPELPETPEDEQTRLPFPEVLRDSWKELFQRRGGAFVLPMPLCVQGKEDRNRNLHSKCVILENDDVAAMMIGSSNFTPRGMGIGVHNFEANLVFQDAASAKHDGLHLVERLRLPKSWEEGLSVDEVIWQTPEELPEDEPNPQSALPAFFAWATYSQVSRELKLGIDLNRQQPQTWSVTLPGTGADAVLFARHFNGPTAESISRTLPDAMRGANIVALLVTWQDDDGDSQQARLGVTIEGVEHLLPPEEFQKLDTEAIIECLISGKTPSQWFDQNIRKGKSERDDAAADSLRSVDTNSLLLYRVRRFGRALSQMSQRIAKTPPHPSALRYRLLNDPFGPIFLAKSISRVEDDQRDEWSRTLEVEHRLFLLIEILLAVAHLQPRVISKLHRRERAAVESVFADTIEQLQQLHEDLEADKSIPGNLRAYVDHVRLLAQVGAKETTEGRHAN